MEDVTANKRKMKELEDNLLFRLTSTKVRSKLLTYIWKIDFCDVLLMYVFS